MGVTGHLEYDVRIWIVARSDAPMVKSCATPALRGGSCYEGDRETAASIASSISPTASPASKRCTLVLRLSSIS